MFKTGKQVDVDNEDLLTGDAHSLPFILRNSEIKIMKTKELEHSKAHTTDEIIEYVANSVVIRTILKKPSGDVRLMSFDSGEGLAEKTSPFDTFAQIIDGKAEIIINGKPNILVAGQSIVIPALAPNAIKPNGRFKMIQTIIKGTYE